MPIPAGSPTQTTTPPSSPVEEVPGNFEDFAAPDLDDDFESELPVPAALPPEEIQERLEEPTGVFISEEEGDVVMTTTAGATETGVEKVWTEPEELLDKSFKLTEQDDLSAGQVQSVEGGAA